MEPPNAPQVPTSATRPTAPPPTEGGHTIRIDVTHPDDPARPMTRTELAMLWDLLGLWQVAPSTEPVIDRDLYGPAQDIRDHIDAELAWRFGG